MKLCRAFLAGVFSSVIAAAGAQAQIAVAGNDGKQLQPGDNPPGIRPDTISVIDLGRYPPKLLATIVQPASMIGPPTAVAVARDSSFALVTASQKPNPADPEKPLPDDLVSVVDLSVPSSPKVIQTVHAGPNATGVSINRAMTLALVASVGDNSITAFSIAGKKLTPVGRIVLDDAKAAPTDVDFTPDGKRALVAGRGDSKITVLAIDGTKVSNTGIDITPGRGPYGMEISPDGKFAYTAILGGIATRAEIDEAQARAAAGGGPAPRKPGAVSVIDLGTNSVVGGVEVGATPEHVALSADGKYLEVTVANNASVPVTAPNFNQVYGLVKVLGVHGATLTPLAEAHSGHWCQGATWSDDSRTLVLQCATERDVEVYHFDGKDLTADPGATLHFDARPGAIATAHSR